ncbi:C-type mannose receptor 2 [Liparis tanakae]|uniref:C-type mannose receptor 2 n=1 Tax=Liparis tanakae TaxID=230148 RepID=A0A4Z2G8L8_9TELE|nr:C-type mannose receptor 2 [Liparis tanakae]
MGVCKRAVLILVDVTRQMGPSYSLEYILIDEKMSWRDAQEYCRGRYDDLATISDEGDNDAIGTMETVRAFWIGLLDDVDSWEWALKKQNEKGKDDYRRWEEGEPDNAGGTQRCVTMTKDGLWTDVSCTLEMPFVCFDDAENPYKLLTTAMTWLNARKFCLENHVDLASVTSLTENKKVKELLSRVDQAWIGLHRDSWMWSNGSASSFRRWPEAQPNSTEDFQPCVQMQQGYWSSSPCETELNFLCQDLVPVAPPTSRRTVKMKMLTTSDLTDPAIRTQILQQVQ